jgi:hypothetical protein
MASAEDKFHKESVQIVNDNIHTYIEDAARYHVDMLNKKIEDGEEERRTYTCMAIGTMLAFSFEAYLNAIGSRKLDLWDERDEYYKKIDKVFQHLKIAPDWGKRPYSSVSAMRRLRNTLAHAQPEVIEKKKEFVDKADQKGKTIDVIAEWKKLCTPDVVLAAYDDHSEVWKDMYQKSGIDVMDLMPSADLTVRTGKKFEVPKSTVAQRTLPESGGDK